MMCHILFIIYIRITFKTVGAQVRHFYKCVIGLIMRIPSYDDIKSIVKDMLIMANYPIESVLEDGNEVPTRESRVRLQRLIRTHDLSFVSSEIEQSEGEVFLNQIEQVKDGDVKCDSSNINWYFEMLNEIQQSAKCFDATVSNLTSNVSINNFPLKVYIYTDILSELPLWSCVMCTHFNEPVALGNSCDVERMYALIKSAIFRNYSLPVSAVVFVENMVKRMNTVTTLMKMNMKQSALQRMNEMGDENENEQNTGIVTKKATTVSKIL